MNIHIGYILAFAQAHRKNEFLYEISIFLGLGQRLGFERSSLCQFVGFYFNNEKIYIRIKDTIKSAKKLVKK